jgi:hypothetical protein
MLKVWNQGKKTLNSWNRDNSIQNKLKNKLWSSIPERLNIEKKNKLSKSEIEKKISIKKWPKKPGQPKSTY